MAYRDTRALLEEVRAGTLAVDAALEQLRGAFSQDLGHSRIDHDRQARVGYPEVVYGAGKTVDQVLDIAACLRKRGAAVLTTRASAEMGAAVVERFPGACYHPIARAITIQPEPPPLTESYIGIVTAGTSDLPVAAEARVTAEFYGNRVELISDVGVAGLHRLLGELDLVRGARVVIVVAGMEGALASVVAGQVDKPVIAVPTSVGYGASFSGLAALLAMLNSCASGVGVVNIDNGFGAAQLASMINKL